MAPKIKRPDKLLQDLRAKSDEDLAKELNEAHRQWFTVRLQLSTRQLTNVSEARKVRRRIARIKTIQRERELEAAMAAVEEQGS
jgi:large subunit ribosomal protein L29